MSLANLTLYQGSVSVRFTRTASCICFTGDRSPACICFTGDRSPACTFCSYWSLEQNNLPICEGGLKCCCCGMGLIVLSIWISTCALSSCLLDNALRRECFSRFVTYGRADRPRRLIFAVVNDQSCSVSCFKIWASSFGLQQGQS